MMKRESHSATVRVDVVSMAAFLSSYRDRDDWSLGHGHIRWQGLAILQQLLDYHLCNLLDVLECFRFRGTPR